ncbi:MAG: T9SS type A sorting domain-containing protein, partial [Bacteroidales bacterium]|nr:T9SS type A sorting domain-containing protein [Bacteroidales bacterium]
TAPTGWKATSSNIRHSYSWMVVDSTGVDGNYSVGAFRALFDTSEDHMYSPAIVVPGDFKVSWQVCAKDASGSDSYTLTVGAEMFNDTIALTTWQSRELLFSVAEGDTVRLDFGRTTNPNSVGFFIDNIVIERLSGTGIHDFATSQTLNVYPNPTNGHITIEGMPEGGHIELYDVTGRLVKTSTKPQINISDCPAGVYILRCISSDGVAARRVIKR